MFICAHTVYMGVVTASAEREDLLAAAVVKAVQGTNAYAGSVFLRSGDRRSLVLAATCGVPPSLLGGWRLIPVNSPIPVAAAYRCGRTIHLADADETARRYPQLAVALPHAFGSCSVPVSAGGRLSGHWRSSGLRCLAVKGCPRRSVAICGPSPTGSVLPWAPSTAVPAIPSTAARRRFLLRSRLPAHRGCEWGCSTGIS